MKNKQAKQMVERITGGRFTHNMWGYPAFLGIDIRDCWCYLNYGAVSIKADEGNYGVN